MRTMNRHAPDRGLTLVEALLALAILSFGIAAMAGLEGRLRWVGDDVRDQDQALRLAQQELERLRLSPRPDGMVTSINGVSNDFLLESSDGVWSPPAADASNGPPPSITPPAPPSPPDTLPLRAIRVTVSWRDRLGVSQSLWLESLVAAHDPALPGLLLRTGG